MVKDQTKLSPLTFISKVTTLSYGAMELRGQPRGPGIADKDAGRLLN